jgi:ferric-dicitrate binding protein FerR (iron transport regulator)
MNRFETLWNGYQAGTLSEAELNEFLALIKAAESPLAGKIDELLLYQQQTHPAPGEKEIILQQVLQQIQQPRSIVRTLPFWKRFGWAAAVLFLITATATYFFINDSRQKHVSHVQQEGSAQTDIAPGRNGAILTLADGSTLSLDSANNGTVATQGNTKVELNNGQLIYKAQGNTTGITYNTMSTPRGRQFSLVLPDGSKVWLNAASSLTYPTAFTGNQRNVTITGEAYFEVAKDKTKPFQVTAGNTTIEVTGTTFNINAYADEAGVNTTLLEGAVQINSGKNAQSLTPGQQAIVSGNGTIQHIKEAATEQAIAWKNGIFNFDKTDLPTMMRQLARWYDVEVVYQGVIPGRVFGGEIERSLHLSQVVSILQRMNIKCTIEGKKLIVQ